MWLARDGSMKWVCVPIVLAASILTLAVTVLTDLASCQLVRPEGKSSRVGTNLGATNTPCRLPGRFNGPFAATDRSRVQIHEVHLGQHALLIASISHTAYVLCYGVHLQLVMCQFPVELLLVFAHAKRKSRPACRMINPRLTSKKKCLTCRHRTCLHVALSPHDTFQYSADQTSA